MLVDEGEPEADRGSGRDRQRHGAAVHGELGTGLGRMEPGENLDQRRLARAVLAEQAMDLPRQDVEGDVVQGKRTAEPLGEMAKGERRGCPRRPFPGCAYFSFHSLAYPSTCWSP